MEGTQLFFQPPTEKQGLDSPKGDGNQDLGRPLEHRDRKTLGKSLEMCLKKSFVITAFLPPFISDTSNRKALSSDNEDNCAYHLLHTPGSLSQKGFR